MSLPRKTLCLLVLLSALGQPATADTNPAAAAMPSAAAQGTIQPAQALRLRIRGRDDGGLIFRGNRDSSEVLFDGSILQAIRWTAIAVCVTVGGSVMIVFASLLRPFLSDWKK